MNQARRGAREKWRQIIKSQPVSGRTIAAYCRDQAITQASFFAWKRRLRPAASLPNPPAPQATGFAEVKTTAEANPPTADGIEVCLRGGRRLLVRHGFDRELLVATIGVLEGI